MVDSEDVGTSGGHLVSIEEDNEYFKRMWSLVPSQGSAEVEPTENDQDISKAIKKMKKKAQKEKKREKYRKKEESGSMEKVAEEKVEPSKKHGKDEDSEKHGKDEDTKKHGRDEDTEYTEIKQKKQKVSDTNEKSSVLMNHKPPFDEVDSGRSASLNHSATQPGTTASPVQNIPVKHKKKQKQGAQTTSVHKGSEQVSDVTSTVSNTNPGPSVSRVEITSELSETDVLQAASINSIEDKREKLRAKIAELQAKRNPTNRERFERKKLKRQESKMKLKQKRKLEKLQKKQNKQNGDGAKPIKGNMNKGLTTPVKPVYNKEGQIVFSKFDFTDSGKKEKKQSDLHGKDYKRLLEKIEKRNEKIHKVKSKDASAGKALEDKFKWESVLHKAEGEKVKDNPELLKKALKKKQKMKDQKKKKWEKRTETVEKMKDDKVKKRNENIQKRKQHVKEKKIQKLKKKGRIVPGF